jgi:hypothetical protein
MSVKMRPKRIIIYRLKELLICHSSRMLVIG